MSATATSSPTRTSRRIPVIEPVLASAGLVSVVVVALILLFIGKEAIPFLQEYGLGSLFQMRWSPASLMEPVYGLLPLISGSLLVTGIAIAIAVPFGIGTAVYIAEIASENEKAWLKPMLEVLAGIPSVVIGFFGLMVLAPFIKSVFHLPSGLTALTGGLILALMAVPTIITIAEDAIRNVPTAYRQASLALGASPMTTIRQVIVPAALPGIIAGVMLGVGRVIGETMAVLMVTGNAAIMTASPLESVRTLTATIAAEMGEVAFGSTHYHALFCVGVVLLIMTLCINLTAMNILRRYRMG
jgi:phosphate transport system permease protein